MNKHNCMGLTRHRAQKPLACKVNAEINLLSATSQIINKLKIYLMDMKIVLNNLFSIL